MTEDSPQSEQLRPLQELLADLDWWTGRSKLTLVDEAIERREEITPYLLTLLETVVADPDGYLEGDHDLLPYALLLLAYFREEASHPRMLSLFQLPGETLDDLIGDMTTGALPLLLLRTCGGSLDGIKGLVLNRDCYDFVRWPATEALTDAVAIGMADRTEMIDFLAGMFTGDEAEPGSYFWTGVAHSLCDLYPAHVMNQLRGAYQKGLILPRTITLEEIEDTLDLGLNRAVEEMQSAVSWRLPDDIEEMLKFCERSGDAPGVAPEPKRREKKQKAQRKKKKKMAKTSRRKNR